VQKEGRRPTYQPLSSGLNFAELRKADVQLRRIPLLRTRVNKDKREGPELLRPGPVVALISRCAPASASREPGHRLRHTLPRPDRLQRTLRLYRPAVDTTAVGVDRVEKASVA
jgi:hypothetical protein